MANNRGKQFEQVIKRAFEAVDGVSIDRVHDQTTRYRGSKNICDFIVYKYPYQYYIECKSVHGNTLPFSNITDAQWEGLLTKSRIKGVRAGILCWWIDKDVTKFLPIAVLKDLKDNQYKSIRYDVNSLKSHKIWLIPAVKKRTYFKYDMEKFLEVIE